MTRSAASLRTLRPTVRRRYGCSRGTAYATPKRRTDSNPPLHMHGATDVSVRRTSRPPDASSATTRALIAFASGPCFPRSTRAPRRRRGRLMVTRAAFSLDLRRQTPHGARTRAPRRTCRPRAPAFGPSARAARPAPQVHTLYTAYSHWLSCHRRTTAHYSQGLVGLQALFWDFRKFLAARAAARYTGASCGRNGESWFLDGRGAQAPRRRAWGRRRTFG